MLDASPAQPLIRLHAPKDAPRPGEADRERTQDANSAAASAPGIAVVIVTWNRKAVVSDALAAVARQDYPLDRLDVVVVDNASTDGTLDFLTQRWRPERIVENPTDRAHEPDFRLPPPPPARTDAAEDAPRNAAGFRSLTIVRNAHNHGGCGGFNTGFAFIERVLDGPGAASPPEFVWLVDDDIDLPPDALTHLTRTAAADPAIGLVGSRTVNFDQRDTTTETTIYFDAERGLMGPEPPPHHRLYADHQRWVAQTGGTKGPLRFSGVREVDVVSACSLLARWSAVKKVGFWDHRYFIYCDDADWSLRFPRHGYRVVVSLDAVVYHTYWLQKLTPTRAYYAQRNTLWMMQKAVRPDRLRRATLRWLATIMRDALKAAAHCRLHHAGIYLRTARDIMDNRGGKLDAPAETKPLAQALADAGATRPGATVLVMATRPGFAAAADDLRRALGPGAAAARWVYALPESHPAPAATSGAALLRFLPSRGSKLRANLPFLLRPPAATIIFDNANDLPLLRSRVNLHIDRKKPEAAAVEADGLLRRGAFLARWTFTAARCILYALRVRPYVPTGKYG